MVAIGHYWKLFPLSWANITQNWGNIASGNVSPILGKQFPIVTSTAVTICIISSIRLVAMSVMRVQCKCLVRRPPGPEIYRRDTLSVYEVTGHSASEYCSNLGLFARLFSRHESLYGCAVQQFTYYLLCTGDGCSSRLIGFFTKVCSFIVNPCQSNISLL